MGYFSNGSEGCTYEARHCDCCLHKQGGCAVWHLHLMWSYEQLDNEGATDNVPGALTEVAKAKATALGELIPVDGITNCHCRMFVQNPARPQKSHAPRAHGHCPKCKAGVHILTYVPGDGTVQCCQRCGTQWTVDAGDKPRTTWLRTLYEGKAPPPSPQKEKKTSGD